MSWAEDRVSELVNNEHRQQGDELAAIAYAILDVAEAVRELNGKGQHG